MQFGVQAKEETLIWFMIKNQENYRSVSNLKFRDGMIIIPKLPPSMTMSAVPKSVLMCMDEENILARQKHLLQCSS